MGHDRPYRALMLPALAVLVPSLFIAVLTTRWISLERETTRWRGAEVAAAALTRLRGDLQRALAARPAPAGLVRESISLDAVGRLTPAEATDDIEPGLSLRAATLLSSAADSLQAGKLTEAAKAAGTILRCCAQARDEFGVSYAVYASWQLATVSRRSPDVTRQSVIDGLRELVDRGVLDRPIDQTGVRALIDGIPGAPGASALVGAVDQRVVRAERQRQLAQFAREWIASIDAPRGAPLVVAPWRFPGTGATLAGLQQNAAGVTVLLVDSQALSAWISDWTDRESSFTFALRPDAAQRESGESALASPLFAETPALIVRARQGSADPATDRQRERLFMAAAAAVLALTMIAGGLAVRDVVRERRLAALRATFLAGVTHEIKTPITSMRLLAETLQQGRANPSDMNELLGTIVNEAEHLSDLVDGLLSTSRIESGARTYRPRVLSMSAAVQAARRRCAYILEKEGFTLVETGMSTSVFVNADSEALQQAVLNLIGNAMKYSGDSRVIRLAVGADESHATVQVADSGVGVPEREQSRIFTSFYRGSAVSQTTTGTGLGLALVRHFAEAHGGRVSVESAQGTGSVFSIVLPRCAEPPDTSRVVLDTATQSVTHHG